jgi:hypothetical protein
MCRRNIDHRLLIAQAYLTFFKLQWPQVLKDFVQIMQFININLDFFQVRGNIRLGRVLRIVPTGAWRGSRNARWRWAFATPLFWCSYFQSLSSWRFTACQ